ncbi:MAG: hypothetical protein IKH59_01710 [Bacteroidaceae bacterium]|nr:hypothetical protein [Bacteroidaceae bacterium]
MNIREKLNKWLQGPRRDYAEGLVLFDVLADKEMQDRYGSFLHAEAAPSGLHFNMLLDKLGRLAQVIRANPLLFQEKMEREFLPSAVPEPARHVPDDKVEELRFSRPGHGVKVVTYPELPEELRQKYDRIKEIVPLMAKLHANLSNTDPVTAGKLADQLCKLDDERRRLWDELDAWADGKTQTTPVKKEESDVVKGMELTRSLKRLRDNIRTSIKAAEKYASEGNAAAAEKARERLARYKQELEELKKKIADEEASA